MVVAIADVAHYVRPGERPGRGSPAPRQLGVLPGPRAADAARGAVQRPVLAASGRGPRLPRGAPVVRPARAQAQASVRARAHALARQTRLRAGAGGGRRHPRRQSRRPCSRAWSARCTAPMRSWPRRDADAAPWTSICPRRRFGSIPDGRPQAIVTRPRLDAHRLIEEFMIAANVAAAETLDQAGMHCMYRIHDAPDPIKLEALAQLLQSLGMGAASGHARASRRPVATARAAEGARAVADRQPAGAARPEPGGVRAAQHRSLRPQSRPLCALHLADPALRRSDRASGADLCPAPRRRMVSRRASRSTSCRRSAPICRARSAAAMEAERNALSRFTALLMSRAHRQHVCRRDHRRAEVRRVRPARRDHGRGPGAGAHARASRSPTILRVRCCSAGSPVRALALGDRVSVELTEVDVLTGQLTFRLVEHTPGAAAHAAGRRRGKGRK